MSLETSQYKRYAQTKESGESWLVTIPSHWNLMRFKSIFRIRKKIAGELGHEVLSITQKGIKLKDTTSGDGQLSMDYSKYQLVSPGDFAMNHMDLLTGYVDISKFKGVTSPDYRVFRLVHRESASQYWLYVLQLCYISKIFFPLGQGAAHIGRWRLPTDGFYEFVGAVPELIEQQKIANFLDHETAKIDTLIEKQQQLIKLLKEKRQAVISHAVTKGLNPDAPMKDSGVEWLGEVPAGWRISRIKYVSTIRYGIGEPPSYVQDGVALIRATNIRSGRISPVGLVYVDPSDIPENRIVWLKAGDVVVVRSGAGTGDSSIIPEKYEQSIAGFDMVVRPTKCNSDFLGYALLSDYLRRNQIDQEKMRAAQPHLNAEELGDCFVLVPAPSEQESITSFLEQSCIDLDRLIMKANDAQTLLKERRTALISTAVTGKIDVRNWQAPESTSTSSMDA